MRENNSWGLKLMLVFKGVLREIKIWDVDYLVWYRWLDLVEIFYMIGIKIF